MHPEPDPHHMDQQQSRMHRGFIPAPTLSGPNSSELAALELALTRALETAPAVPIPPGFAARVSARIVTEASTLRKQPSAPAPLRFGILAALIAAVLLLVAMFVYAARAGAPTPASLTVEFSFLAEFALLTVWMYLDPQRLRP